MSSQTVGFANAEITANAATDQHRDSERMAQEFVNDGSRPKAKRKRRRSGDDGAGL